MKNDKKKSRSAKRLIKKQLHINFNNRRGICQCEKI